MKYLSSIGKVCLVLGMVLIAGCSLSGPDTEELYQRAEASAAEQKFSSAVTDLKTILQDDPDSGKARLLLGEVYLNMGDSASALKELKRVRGVGNYSTEALPALVKALYLQGEVEAVLELPVPEDLSDSELSEIHTYRGLSQHRAVAGEGVSSLEKAIDLDPESASAYVAMATLLLATGDPQGARDSADKALEINPEFGPAWSISGSINQEAGNLVEAEEDFTQAIKYSYAKDPDYYKRAFVRINNGDMEGAQKDLEILMKRYTNSPEINFLQGLVRFNGKHYKDGLTNFDRVLTFDKDHYPAIYYAGVSNYLLGNMETSKNMLNKYVSEYPTNVQALRILASINYAQKNFSEGDEFSNELLKLNEGDTYTLDLVAKSYQSRGMFKEGVEVREKLFDIDPNSVDGQFQLGLAYIKSGDMEAGIQALEKTIEMQPDHFGAWRNLVLAKYHKGDVSGALDDALTFQQDNSERVESNLLAAMMYMKVTDEANAEKYFKNAAAIEKGNPSAYSGLAALALSNKDLDGAVSYYNEALKEHPEDLGTLINLASVRMAQEDIPKAVETLNTAIEAHPDSLKARLNLANAYWSDQENDQAMQVLVQAERDFDGNATVLALLSEARVKTGDFTGAKYDLERFVAQQPDNAKAHYSLAMINLQLGNSKEYESLIKKSLELNAKNPDAIKEMAKININSGKFDQANENIKDLKNYLGDRADVLILEGTLAKEQGDLETAVNLYGQAYETSRNNFNLIYLVSALWETEQKDQAVNLQEDWLKDNPNDTMVSFDLAGRYLELEKTEKAAKIYSGLLESQPENIVILNNLAWILKDQDPKKSIEYSKKAVGINPDSAALRDTYAMALLSDNNLDLAKIMIDKAKNLASNDPSISYHRALIFSKAGDVSEAKKELISLLDKGVPFPEKENAEKMLLTLSDG